jgi:hypothetical protein
VESYIDLRDKEPVYKQQFRLPMKQIEFIKENVMGWLDAGIFKKANSPYNSPIFCLPKKQGHGLRCVLDFRRLNLKTTESKNSIRCIDQCLEEVGRAGSKIFSCLDMRNRFWNQVLRGNRQTLHSIHNTRDWTIAIDSESARTLWSASSFQ